MTNAFCHVELSTTDPDQAKTFYTDLFSWTMADMEMGSDMTYTTIQPGDGPGGGLMKQTIPNAPSAWLPYVLVGDVRAATARAASLGGAVLKDVSEVPGMGWFSIISDPTGAPLGLWQAA